MDATMHCRENGSLFDVSHMCGLTLKVLLPDHGNLAPCMLTLSAVVISALQTLSDDAADLHGV